MRYEKVNFSRDWLKYRINGRLVAHLVNLPSPPPLEVVSLAERISCETFRDPLKHVISNPWSKLCFLNTFSFEVAPPPSPVTVHHVVALISFSSVEPKLPRKLVRQKADFHRKVRGDAEDRWPRNRSQLINMSHFSNSVLLPTAINALPGKQSPTLTKPSAVVIDELMRQKAHNWQYQCSVNIGRMMLVCTSG